ncbi:MAG: hypothetical protein ABR953_05925 [Candidatus Acidiferrales bacterium]|jgi:hypothetical protein
MIDDIVGWLFPNWVRLPGSFDHLRRNQAEEQISEGLRQFQQDEDGTSGWQLSFRRFLHFHYRRCSDWREITTFPN